MVNVEFFNKEDINEIATIKSIEVKEMWGLKGKEQVEVVRYEIRRNDWNAGKTEKRTLYSIFLEKYQTLSDLRNDKINKILNIENE